jgi:hypothetical protein
VAKIFGGCGQARNEAKGVVCTFPILCAVADGEMAVEQSRLSCLHTFPKEEGYTEHVVLLIGWDGEFHQWEGEESTG